MPPSPLTLLPSPSPIDSADVKRDIDAMLWSMKLCSIRRYFHQRFWETETMEAEYASRLEPFPRLETVADHSWHVADTVLLLSGHFPALNVDRCLRLAILHDKMEISIGDKNPVGKSGTGESTHAFNFNSQAAKEASERAAIERYVSRIRSSAAPDQRDLLIEVLEGRTTEARFVKAIDKLQALAFVTVKKRGVMLDKHLRFTIKYSEKAVMYFPDLLAHYDDLKARLMALVAKKRNVLISELEQMLYDSPLSMSLFQDD
jgi:5'-deoxynucleotidase YfbR-like HD superfamily hydrolase